LPPIIYEGLKIRRELIPCRFKSGREHHFPHLHISTSPHLHTYPDKNIKPKV
jgi:hypothetical protein